MFRSSNILKDHTWATEVKEIDLPVEAISHLLITLQGFNATDETKLGEILAYLNKVVILHNGKSIISMESTDLFALNCFLLGAAPVLTTSIATDNVSRALTLILPFGRSLFNPKECLPKTKKGELKLQLDCTVPATDFDNGVINVQCVELPGASPDKYLKSTLTKVVAPGATGDNDVDLPMGNLVAGIMLFSTTVFQTSSHTQGIEEVRVLVNNSEFGYVSGKYLSLIGQSGINLNQLVRVPAAAGELITQHYAYLDYDPVKNDEFLIDTSDVSSFKVRLNMGVNEACRVLPVEIASIEDLLK
jgi:hypothetical protein